MKKQKKLVYIITSLVLFFALFYDIVLFGGNLQFYAKWAQCGNRPIQTKMAPGHSVPWYAKGEIFAVMRTKVWYCSPIEAEKAGFSASPNQQEFSHLKGESE